MVWLVDIGNSRMKVAFLGKGGRFQVARKLRAKRGDHVYVASVVPAKTKILRRSLKRRAQLFVIQAKDLSAAFAYRSTLGVDRALQIWHIARQNRGGAVVVSVGTAITVDVISPTGRHKGGWILPGPQILGAALSEQTALLPPVVLRRNRVGLGKSTVQSLSFGQAALFRGVAAEICSAAKRSCEIIVSGGGASLFAKFFPKERRVRVKPNLVLEALADYGKHAESDDHSV